MDLSNSLIDWKVISCVRLINFERIFTWGQFLKKTITKQLWVVWCICMIEILFSVLVMLRCSLGGGGYPVAELILSTFFYFQLGGVFFPTFFFFPPEGVFGC